MNRLCTAGLLTVLFCAPALASYTPLYVGAQLDNDTTTALLGYQISKTWSMEAHAHHRINTIRQAGAISETRIRAMGLSALYRVPITLRGGSSFFLFGKAGYERTIQDVTFSFPASVTYSGNYRNYTNRGRIGIGVQYDFYEHLSGRSGIDAFSADRSVYVSVIFSF